MNRLQITIRMEMKYHVFIYRIDSGYAKRFIIAEY